MFQVPGVFGQSAQKKVKFFKSVHHGYYDGLRRMKSFKISMKQTTLFTQMRTANSSSSSSSSSSHGNAISPVDALQQRFGFKAFRPNQSEVVAAVLAGHDVLVLQPTGAGKSLCYQLPSVIFPPYRLTLVVCPLIVLMEDQVRHLKSRGIDAAVLHSGLSAATRKQILMRITSATTTISSSSSASSSPVAPLRLLYITPELATGTAFRDKVLTPLYAAHRLALFAIDEAHCVSSWGHDFRPAYRRLGVLRSKFPSVPIIALTATATLRVQLDIMASLGQQQVRQFNSGFDRPNVYYAVRYVDALPGQDFVADMVDCISNLDNHLNNNLPKSSPTISRPAKPTTTSGFVSAASLVGLSTSALSHSVAKTTPTGIVYAPTRARVESIASAFRSQGLAVGVYHAGLNSAQRQAAYNDWVSNVTPIMCATVAFGMGVDKPNVRFVFHAGVPGSMEAYYQESGRAGRDGKPSVAFLYYSQHDRARQQFFQQQKLAVFEEGPDIDSIASNSSIFVPSKVALPSSATVPPQSSSSSSSSASAAASAKTVVSEGAATKTLPVDLFHAMAIYCEPFRDDNVAHARLCRRQMILKYFADEV
jgi:RecQ family ATP-dependent DNA helicase